MWHASCGFCALVRVLRTRVGFAHPCRFCALVSVLRSRASGIQRIVVACGWLSVNPALVMRMKRALAWNSSIDVASQ